jgi:hypothetical protein
MTVDMGADMLSIASSLLTVFSVQVAFLGILSALFFSKTWSARERIAFKVLISSFFLSVVIMGGVCGYIISLSTLQEINILFNFPVSIIIYIVIGCLVIGAFFITIVVI